MYGAMLGDIIGSPYEFLGGDKTTSFPLFTRKSRFTDDTVMSFGICQGLLDCDYQIGREEIIKDSIIQTCQKWGRAYPNAGYGGHFINWLFTENPEPYNSFGNGSAMRVSSVGWLFGDLDRTRQVARWSAEISHNHPEGVKGAESVASAIWMAREGYEKGEIKKYIEEQFDYDLSMTCDDIRPGYRFDVSCQGSVPQAIISFLESNSFEDAVRNAVSLGGDTDTQGAIAGSIAEAYYGIPDPLMEKCRAYMTDDMVSLSDRFEDVKVGRRAERKNHQAYKKENV